MKQNCMLVVAGRRAVILSFISLCFSLSPFPHLLTLVSILHMHLVFSHMFLCIFNCLQKILSIFSSCFLCQLSVSILSYSKRDVSLCVLPHSIQ